MQSVSVRLTEGALEEKDGPRNVTVPPSLTRETTTTSLWMSPTSFRSWVMSVPDVRLSVSDVHLIDQSSVAGEFLGFSL